MMWKLNQLTAHAAKMASFMPWMSFLSDDSDFGVAKATCWLRVTSQGREFAFGRCSRFFGSFFDCKHDHEPSNSLGHAALLID
jgi:hypothetical protein